MSAFRLSFWDLAGVAALISFLVILLVSGLRKARRTRMPEHAVLVRIPLSNDEFGSPDERERIHALADRLRLAIDEEKAGEYDGDEFGEGGCILYMYGSNADALFRAVVPVFKGWGLPAGSRAIKRYGSAGDPKAREEEVTL
jgi:hypothetical protein